MRRGPGPGPSNNQRKTFPASRNKGRGNEYRARGKRSSLGSIMIYFLPAFVVVDYRKVNGVQKKDLW